MALVEMKNKIHNVVRSFRRSYTTSVFFFPEDDPPTSIIQVKQDDLYHDMALYITIRLDSMAITDIDVEENRVPYPQCPNAITIYHSLIGQNLARLNLEKMDHFKRSKGCIHVNELIEQAKQNFTTAYAFFLKEELYPTEWNEEKMFTGSSDREFRRELARHWWMKDRRVKNSCYAFAQEREAEKIELLKDTPTLTEMMLKNMRKKKQKEG